MSRFKPLDVEAFEQEYQRSDPARQEQMLNALIDYRDALGSELSRRGQLEREQKKQEEESKPTAGDFANLVGQGVTLGALDEFKAGVRSLTNSHLSYGNALNQEREKLAKARERTGGVGTAVEVASGLLTPAGLAGSALKGATTANKIKGLAKAGAVTGAVAGGFSGNANNLEEAVQDVATGGAIGGLTGGAIPAIGAGIKTASSKTASAVRRFRGQKEPDEILDQVLAKELDTPNPNRVTQLRDTLQDAQNQGDLTVLADIGGDSVQGLTRTLSRYSGDARDTIADVLEGRSAGAVERVTNQLQKRISNTGVYFGKLQDQIKLRSEQASPIYKEAFSNAKPVNLPKKLVEDDRLVRAIADGVRNYGVPAQIPKLSLQSLDGAKKSLGDTIGKALRDGKGEKVKAYTELKNELVGVLDNYNPTYKKARAIFADETSLIVAQKEGLRFSNFAPEQIQKLVDDYSPSQLEAYKIGVAESLRKVAENTTGGGNPVRRIFGNPAQKKRLRAIFKGNDFNAFAKRLESETLASKAKDRILGGSRTDINLASDLSVLQKIRSNGLLIGSLDIVTDYIGNKYQGLNQKNIVELAKILVDQNKGIEALNRLIANQSTVQKRILTELRKDFLTISSTGQFTAQSINNKNE